MKSNGTFELTDKQINLLKINRIKDYAEYVEKEIENDLFPNTAILDNMMELIIDIKRSVPNWKILKI